MVIEHTNASVIDGTDFRLLAYPYGGTIPHRHAATRSWVR